MGSVPYYALISRELGMCAALVSLLMNGLPYVAFQWATKPKVLPLFQHFSHQTNKWRKIQVLRDAAPHQWVGSSQHVEGLYWLHLESHLELPDPEDEGKMILQDVRKYSPTTKCHIPEVMILQQHFYENLKSHK